MGGCACGLVGRYAALMLTLRCVLCVFDKDPKCVSISESKKHIYRLLRVFVWTWFCACCVSDV